MAQSQDHWMDELLNDFPTEFWHSPSHESFEACPIHEMALPVHELFKDRDVWEFWRETGVFSEAIPRICDHIETLILRYGALYGLVVWLGTDGKLYIVASANLGLGFTYIPLRLLTQSLRPYVDEIPGHRRHWIRVDKLKNIYGRGSQDKAGNSKGYHNKKAAFSLLQKRLAESQDLPVLALVYANDKYLTLCHPQKDTAMEMLMEKVIRYYQSLSDDGCMSQIRPNISFLPPSVHVDSSRRPRRTSNVLSRPSRRKRTSKTGENQSPVDEWEAMEFVHEPGSLPWYCHAIKDPNGTGVAALIKTDKYYKWAFADARCHGPGGSMRVHHNLLVEVESELDPMGHLRCSCAVFRNCLEPKECVHTLYTRVNSERLRSMAFSKEGEVVTIMKNNSSTAGYYVDGCFVRMQGDRGLRCDSDKAFGCRHVARVREALHLDVDPEEEESESTPDPSCSSSDDEADVLPTNAWISDTSKTFKIEYPYSDALKRAVMERLLFGFSRDKEGTPLGPLQPPMPASTTCDCGLPYTRRGFKETDPVTVYMRPPHCARSLPCMVLKCQRGAPECTLHYTGLEDGLWRASKTVAVELDLLVRCARDFVGFRGHSLTAQRDSISEMYDMVSDTIPTESFLVANAFRKAVYGVASCLHFDTSDISRSMREECGAAMPPNAMMCPICQDSPDVIIMDGTSMSISASLCSAESFTARKGNQIIRRTHLMVERCFFNVSKGSNEVPERRAGQRREVIKLVQDFESWIESKDTPQGFVGIHRLRSLADTWNLGDFVAWVHESCREGRLSVVDRKAVKAMLRELRSDSPTTSYLSYESSIDLDGCLEAGRVVGQAVMGKVGPILKNLLRIVQAPGQEGAVIPIGWVTFLREIVERSRWISEINCGERELGDDIPHPCEASAVNGDFLRNGVCCGLPRLRFRPPYACDGQKDDSKVSEKDKASCKHAFHKPGKRTGGVFTCMCQHGVAYASFIIKNAEGRDEPFTFLTCYLKKAPRVVVYDFACALMDYCLNRAPDFFKFTLFVVDAFHWVNHVACARIFPLNYTVR
eukprot:jgi/Picre1/29389/NNA_004777.t1